MKEAKEKGLEVTASTNPEALISKALDNNVSVETMEKLLGMRRELKAEWAKEQYDQAMAKFQAECPIIKKTKIVYEKNQENLPVDKRKVRYRYAPIDAIIEQTKKPIAANNLSYAIRTAAGSKEGMLNVIIRISHIAGHSEESGFEIPIGTEQFMSEVQKYGARVTFAKRYVFLNAFGIMTGDDDTDAAPEEGDNIDQLFAKGMKMIGEAKTAKALEELKARIKASKKGYSDDQKTELSRKVDLRIAELKAVK